LQVAQFIVVHSQDVWHGQAPFRKMIGKVYKGVVLVPTISHHTDNAFTVAISQAVILSVTSGLG